MKLQPVNLKSLFTKSLLATTLLASCLTLLSSAKPAHAQQYHVNPNIADWGGYEYGYDPNGGLYYAFNRIGNRGNVDFELYTGGSYSVAWDSLYNEFTAGKGWNPGTYDRTINYNCTSYRNDNGGAFGAYGWTKSPNLCEYYVNEIYGDNPPKGDDDLGSFVTDNATYDNYHTYTFGATIEGDKYFDQYVSNRRDLASIGDTHSINMTNHFDFWQNWANPRGKYVPTRDSNFDYQIMLTEGYSGNGQAASGYCAAWLY